MKMKQKKLSYFLAVGGFVAAFTVAGLFSASPVFAEEPDASELGSSLERCDDTRGECYECNGVYTSFEFDCPEDDSGFIFSVLQTILTVASIGVGIAAVGGIIWGAILYASAQGNSQQVQSAISVIFNAVLALILFFGMFALINFLIPGGIFT